MEILLHVRRYAVTVAAVMSAVRRAVRHSIPVPVLTKVASAAAM